MRRAVVGERSAAFQAHARHVVLRLFDDEHAHVVQVIPFRVIQRCGNERHHLIDARVHRPVVDEVARCGNVFLLFDHGIGIADRRRERIVFAAADDRGIARSEHDRRVVLGRFARVVIYILSVIDGIFDRVILAVNRLTDIPLRRIIRAVAFSPVIPQVVVRIHEQQFDGINADILAALVFADGIQFVFGYFRGLRFVVERLRPDFGDADARLRDRERLRSAREDEVSVRVAERRRCGVIARHARRSRTRCKGAVAERRTRINQGNRDPVFERHFVGKLCRNALRRSVVSEGGAAEPHGDGTDENAALRRVLVQAVVARLVFGRKFCREGIVARVFIRRAARGQRDGQPDVFAEHVAVGCGIRMLFAVVFEPALDVPGDLRRCLRDGVLRRPLQFFRFALEYIVAARGREGRRHGIDARVGHRTVRRIADGIGIGHLHRDAVRPDGQIAGHRMDVRRTVVHAAAVFEGDAAQIVDRRGDGIRNRSGNLRDIVGRFKYIHAHQIVAHVRIRLGAVRSAVCKRILIPIRRSGKFDGIAVRKLDRYRAVRGMRGAVVLPAAHFAPDDRELIFRCLADRPGDLERRTAVAFRPGVVILIGQRELHIVGAGVHLRLDFALTIQGILCKHGLLHIRIVIQIVRLFGRCDARLCDGKPVRQEGFRRQHIVRAIRRKSRRDGIVARIHRGIRAAVRIALERCTRIGQHDVFALVAFEQVVRERCRLHLFAGIDQPVRRGDADSHFPRGYDVLRRIALTRFREHSVEGDLVVERAVAQLIFDIEDARVGDVQPAVRLLRRL